MGCFTAFNVLDERGLKALDPGEASNASQAVRKGMIGQRKEENEIFCFVGFETTASALAPPARACLAVHL